MSTTPAHAEAAIQDRPAELLAQLLRFDTTNPPGNVHRPAPGSNPRRSRIARPAPSNGIVAATGLGLKYAA